MRIRWCRVAALVIALGLTLWVGKGGLRNVRISELEFSWSHPRPDDRIFIILILGIAAVTLVGVVGLLTRRE